MSYAKPRYFTGTPCARGHVCERYTGSRACVECAKINAENHKARHPGAAAAAAMKHRESNPEASKASAALYRLNNRAEVRAAQKKYAQSNPAKLNSKWSSRRARKASAVPLWFGEFDEFVLVEAFDLAKRREAITGFAWHIDHAIPLAARTACGLHCAANIQVIPAAMNVAKGNKMQLTNPGDWVRHGQ